MRERAGTWMRRIVVAIVILLPGLAVLTFAAFEVSSQPRFCGSCHVMAPYYDSWKSSSHNDVACVECHIPPGITSEFRKKYEALSMVVRYFTGTYSTNPWAQVDDQSCLRSGCHETRVLLGREVYQGVLFDHQPHLEEMRRDKRLRCTSCHSQIVQGSHIAVTPTTCFLCHFKDVAPNTATARCTLCHAVPEQTIATTGLAFDHGEVKRLGMKCMDCHEGVVRGAGEVPRERCFTCHNDATRLKRYGETELLHRTHVTDHKVECLHCHIEIRHGIPEREAALATGCETCHSAAAGHSAVRDLYRGIGAKDVAPRPAAMYLAGVRCEACHNRPHGEHRSADEVSCMTCHGPRYLTMYRSWQAGLDARLTAVKDEVERATAAVASHDGGLPPPLADARENVTLLEQGHAIHNPRYALDVLAKAHGAASETLAAAGESVPTSPPWPQAPYESECLGCHFGIELLSGPAFGREFPHRRHVVDGRLRCTVCHGEGATHGTLRLTAADCDRCHHRIETPMAGVAPEECLGCHPAAIGAVSEKVRFPHERHIEAGFDCALCHPRVAEARHRTLIASGDALPALGHEFCGTCHSGDVPQADGTSADDANCARCHVAF